MQRLLNSPFRRLSGGFVLFTAIAASSYPTLARNDHKLARSQTAGWVGVVGHWMATEDGGPAFHGDGTKWSGTTDRTYLERTARSLFNSVTETFLTNGTAPQAFPLAVWQPIANFSEGTLRVPFKLVGGASDQTAGIVIGLRATGEYLFVRYNTKDGNLAVWQYSGGERRVIAHGHDKKQLPLNVWHELSVHVADRQVRGDVVGHAIHVEHTLDQPLAGRVGVWTKRDAISSFRDLRLTK